MTTPDRMTQLILQAARALEPLRPSNKEMPAVFSTMLLTMMLDARDAGVPETPIQMLDRTLDAVRTSIISIIPHLPQVH